MNVNRSQIATDCFLSIRKITDELTVTGETFIWWYNHIYSCWAWPWLWLLGHDCYCWKGLALFILLLITESWITVKNTASFIGINGSLNVSTRQQTTFTPRSRGGFREGGYGYHHGNHSTCNHGSRGQHNSEPVYDGAE